MSLPIYDASIPWMRTPIAPDGVLEKGSAHCEKEKNLIRARC